MWEQPRIADLRPSDEVTGFFVVRKKQIRTKRETNEPYLSLELGDASGRIGASLWQEAREWYDRLQEGNVVKVQGTVLDFQNRLHLSLKRVRLATESDPLEEVDLLPKSEVAPEELLARIEEVVEGLDDVGLRELLQRVFTDEELRPRLLQAPAAKLWHHSYVGGLLEHTLSVATIVDFLAAHYPDVDRDLLVAGALLHDIGKVFELEVGGFVDYSDPGRLLGHITLGVQLITVQAVSVPELTANRLNQLLHLVLSHHGEPEKGSPVKPQTVEAFLLHYADEMDSKVAGVQRIVRKESEPGKQWSGYVKLLDRFIYLGSKK